MKRFTRIFSMRPAGPFSPPEPVTRGVGRRGCVRLTPRELNAGFDALMCFSALYNEIAGCIAAY